MPVVLPPVPLQWRLMLSTSTSPSASSPRPLTVFGLPAPWLLAPLLLLSMWVVYVAAQRMIERQAAPQWPQVTAVVTSAKVGRTRYGHTPEISYRYTVHGQPYTGDAVYLDQRSMAKSSAMAEIAPYPVGRTLQVHHDPDRPERAVIHPQAQGSALFLMGLGLFMAVVCVVCMRKLARL
jgi:hypothetical protein